MADDIVWEDPPKVKTYCRPRVWEKRLAPLHARPGVWARVAIVARGAPQATHLRKGEIAGVDPTLYEFTTRSTPDGRRAIYARYVGKPKAIRSA